MPQAAASAMEGTFSRSMQKTKPRVDSGDTNRHGRARARTVEELTRRNIDTIIRLEEATKGRRTTVEIVADAITRFCGSMTFVWLHVVWYSGWIVANVFLPPGERFDPFPFSFLTLIVSLEAIF